MSESDWARVLGWCQNQLCREGFKVFWVPSEPRKRGVRPPDLLAMKGSRILRILVVTQGDIDMAETKTRVLKSLNEGETRVFAPWQLRWRMLSNLERWGFDGVPVAGW